MHEWMSDAKCRDHDPDLFFPESGDTDGVRGAVEVCRRCPVIYECSVYRKEVEACSGVWHGQWFRVSVVSPDVLRREALGLAAGGVSAEQIAGDLGVSLAQVRRWLRREERRLESPTARPLKRTVSVELEG